MNMRCPNCESELVRRSRRQTRDWLCLALLRRPMRCNRCHCRFYASLWTQPKRVVVQRRHPAAVGPVSESLKLDPDAKPDLSGLELPPRPDDAPDDAEDDFDLRLAR